MDDFVTNARGSSRALVMMLRSSHFLRCSLLAVGLGTSSLACGQVLDVGSNQAQADGGAPPTGDDPAAVPGAPTGPDAWFPTSACTLLGTTPKLLAERSPGQDIRGLAPDGDTLYFTSLDEAAQGGLGRLWSTSVTAAAGTPPTPLAVDKVQRLAGVSGGRIVYVETSHAGNGTKLDPAIQGLVLLDLATGDAIKLPNPAGTTYVSAVDVTTSGITWLSRAWDATFPESISHWRGGVLAGSITSLQNHSFTTTDGVDVFYSRFDTKSGGTNTIRFEAAPIAGGAPRVLRTMPYDRLFTYAIVAVDDTEVYFTQLALINGGTVGAGDLRAMKKDGTGERVLVSAEKYGTASFRIDPDYVTWNDQDAQQTIVRVPRAGGALERIIPGAKNRWVNTIAVDRCNIYWAVANPPAIYARSRLP